MTVETALDEAMYAVTAAIGRGDIPAAREAFDAAVDEDPDRCEALVIALGKTMAPPRGAVHVGDASVVWANPYRVGYAWRCGSCPAIGSNLTAGQGARAAAERHAAEHTDVTVVEVCQR